MIDRRVQFARQLAHQITVDNDTLRIHSASPEIIQATDSNNTTFNLDLTPFAAAPATADADEYFGAVASVSDLLSAYRAARQRGWFEEDIAPAMAHVSGHAQQFLGHILNQASAFLTDAQAALVGQWVRNLDRYTAVRAVESLLNSRADLKLLEIAADLGWNVHFDHLAIRCGTRARHDAERVVELLTDHHGYVASQLPHEAFYQFPDGWNAYPLYKILDNGQVLRLFVDQSDAGAPAQIIQHWNHVYGYTAHHLAIRATETVNGCRTAVPLPDVMQALQNHGVAILTPTGHYTCGLLLQVFTKPERSAHMPEELKARVARHGAELARTIENGKLLELVSRKEMPPQMAAEYFALYGLRYDPQNPLHSAPVYQYFLPAQAAHVIKTSQEVA